MAVIGAGACGLTATKACLDEGLEPVCFERADDLGGLWRFTEKVRDGQSCVMNFTVSKTTKEMSSFSDFPATQGDKIWILLHGFFFFFFFFFLLFLRRLLFLVVLLCPFSSYSSSSSSPPPSPLLYLLLPLLLPLLLTPLLLFFSFPSFSFSSFFSFCDLIDDLCSP